MKNCFFSYSTLIFLLLKLKPAYIAKMDFCRAKFHGIIKLFSYGIVYGEYSCFGFEIGSNTNSPGEIFRNLPGYIFIIISPVPEYVKCRVLLKEVAYFNIL